MTPNAITDPVKVILDTLRGSNEPLPAGDLYLRHPEVSREELRSALLGLLHDCQVSIDTHMRVQLVEHGPAV